MHTLGSQSLTQISTKLERERKKKRWIFNLHTHKWHSISLKNLSLNHERERGERRTLAHQEQQWGMGVVRKEGRS
jgi:hypothetical protein